MTILSFTDAEFLEDGLEEVGGGDGAGDGGEVVEGGAEVLGDEVAGEACAESLEDGRGGGCCLAECLGMADVGDKDGVLVGGAA